MFICFNYLPPFCERTTWHNGLVWRGQNFFVVHLISFKLYHVVVPESTMQKNLFTFLPSFSSLLFFLFVSPANKSCLKIYNYFSSFSKFIAVRANRKARVNISSTPSLQNLPTPTPASPSPNYFLLIHQPRFSHTIHTLLEWQQHQLDSSDFAQSIHAVVLLQDRWFRRSLSTRSTGQSSVTSRSPWTAELRRMPRSSGSKMGFRSRRPRRIRSLTGSSFPTDHSSSSERCRTRRSKMLASTGASHPTSTVLPEVPTPLWTLHVSFNCTKDTRSYSV